MKDMLEYEKEAWDSGLFLVAGVDEAGRGPLAGPVVAAAVVFEREPLERDGLSAFAGLTDSKALTEKKRDLFFEQLCACSFAHCSHAVIEPEEIDALNILKATWKAMRLALVGLERLPEMALVDGNPVRGLPCESKYIIKGDARSLSIAAASVIAKVTRDRLMTELDVEFPEYGFAAHKGYGTQAHLDAIRTYGPLPCHRKSFRPIYELNQREFGF